MVFELERAVKYRKALKFLANNGFYSILSKAQQIEEVLENGSWLQPKIKSQFKIEKLTGYKNYWKCKYIHSWRLVFTVDENIITIIDLDRRNTIYNHLNLIFII